ncbi:MFS transporter [Rhizobium sp. 11_C7_N12_5]|uniref:MFS transporter n=1 Tax=Rhizobium sp. 11_C7_N12_5 TaxID=3240770 RepID=UPI003F1F35BA
MSDPRNASRRCLDRGQFDLVAALVSYPMGFLSDRISRRDVLLAAFAVFFVAYAGFALTVNVVIVAVVFVCYGAYRGTFRAAGKALASSLVPRELRAGGIGWYNSLVGLTQLIARSSPVCFGITLAVRPCSSMEQFSQWSASLRS